MYSVLPEDRSQRLGEELQGRWDQEAKRAQKDAREPSLTKAIVKCYWKPYVVWGMFAFLEVSPCLYQKKTDGSKSQQNPVEGQSSRRMNSA